jgi:hypothetical protein
VNNLRANLPPNQQSPLNLVRKLMENQTCSFALHPVHPETVEKIISSMKSTKSCGLDNIDSYIIKLAKDPCYHPHPESFDKPDDIPSSLEDCQGHPPVQEGRVNGPKNYRPVALLAFFPKF